MFSIKLKGKKIKANKLSELINKLTRIGLKGKIVPIKGLKNNNFLFYIDLENHDKVLREILSEDQDLMNQVLEDELVAQEEAIAQFDSDQQGIFEEYHEAQIVLEQEYLEMMNIAEEELRELQIEDQEILKLAKELHEEEMVLLASLDEDIEFIYVPKKRR